VGPGSKDYMLKELKTSEFNILCRRYTELDHFYRFDEESGLYVFDVHHQVRMQKIIDDVMERYQRDNPIVRNVKSSLVSDVPSAKDRQCFAKWTKINQDAQRKRKDILDVDELNASLEVEEDDPKDPSYFPKRHYQSGKAAGFGKGKPYRKKAK
jgi:hypothetical protein